MYARVPHGMAQFVLKIEKLTYIIGTAPILEMARTYGLRPRLWLLILADRRGTYSKGRLFEGGWGGGANSRIYGTLVCPASLTFRLVNYKNERVYTNFFEFLLT